MEGWCECVKWLTLTRHELWLVLLRAASAPPYKRLHVKRRKHFQRFLMWVFWCVCVHWLIRFESLSIKYELWPGFSRVGAALHADLWVFSPRAVVKSMHANQIYKQHSATAHKTPQIIDAFPVARFVRADGTVRSMPSRAVRVFFLLLHAAVCVQWLNCSNWYNQWMTL